MTWKSKDEFPEQDPHRYRPVPLAEDRRPWHRQPHETNVAFSDFMTFLTLGEKRTLTETARIVGKSHSTISKWSAKWNWYMRAAAYEEHYLLLRLESIEAEKDEMFVRHRAVAQTALTIVEQSLASKQEQILEQIRNEEPVTAMKDDSLIRLFDVALKAERMAVLGRVESAERADERNERLAEKFSEELAHLMADIMDGAELSEEQQEKAKAVMARHFAETR